MREIPRAAHADIGSFALRPDGPEYPAGSLTSNPQGTPERQPDFRK
jgi:hypothetical protein